MAQPTAQTKTGNTDAVPEQIQWTTPEQLEKYDKLFSVKHFVKKGKDGKPDSKDADYFYEIVATVPTQPSGYLGNETVLQFSIQKYSATQFDNVTTDRRNAITGKPIVEKKPKMVAMRSPSNPDGELDASFYIDADRFANEYIPKPDNLG